MNVTQLAPEAPGAAPDVFDPRPVLVETPSERTPERAGPERTSEPAEPGQGSARPRSGSIGRIVGLDLARALAVFGMYYAHVGPYTEGIGFTAWLMDIPHGRSSALFATLAGLSLVLLAGGNHPKTGREGRQAAVKIVIRAAILLALGTLLTASGTSIAVILAFYGVYFLLALPFIRLRARTLAILAGAVAVAGPVLHSLAGWIDPDRIMAFDSHDPLSMWGGDGLSSLLLSGTYPAVTWMAYIFAGMAIGKLDLADKATRIRLAIIGPALALIGYGSAWLLMRAPKVQELLGWTDEMAAKSDAEWEAWNEAKMEAWKRSGWVDGSGELTDKGLEMMDKDYVDAGSFSWHDLALLVDASPHSGTPFEVIGNIGVAILVIVGAVVLLSRFALARKLLVPITAVGAMSLTVYVGHIVAVWFLFDRPDATEDHGFAVWGYLVAGALVFAFAWSRFFRRGPLEYGMAAATRLARFVK